MGQDGANRYAYVYNHPTTFIDPSGFDGDFPDFDFDFDAGGTFYSYPDMSVGTAGYYTPPADISSGMSQMSYAGGQSYAGDSGQWGAAGAYCADSYSSYMSAQYGALGETIANQQLNVFQNPVSSSYPDDSSLKYYQYGAFGLGVGAGLGAIYLGAAAAAPLIYAYASDLLGLTAATSPELVAAGAAAVTGAAPELESLAPEVSSVASESVSLYRAVSPEEFYDVMTTGMFRSAPGGESLAAKQFGLTLDEALNFANKFPDIGAIVRVEIPQTTFNQLDFSTSIDPFIFSSGVVSAQPGFQQNLLNQTLISIGQAY